MPRLPSSHALYTATLPPNHFPLCIPSFSFSGCTKISSSSRTKDPQATVKAHIKLLHDYNEIRDIGQGLMAIIADNRVVRVSDVYRDFDVGEGD